MSGSGLFFPSTSPSNRPVPASRCLGLQDDPENPPRFASAVCRVNLRSSLAVLRLRRSVSSEDHSIHPQVVAGRFGVALSRAAPVLKLQAATSTTGRIAAREDIRRHLISEIERRQYDVTDRLEKPKSPYALVLTRTQGSWKRALSRCQLNQQLLKSLPAPD